MTQVGRNTFETIKRALLPALAILIIANFLGYAIMGANGILSWGDYRRQKAERLVEITSCTRKRSGSPTFALLDPRAPIRHGQETVTRLVGVVRPDRW